MPPPSPQAASHKSHDPSLPHAWGPSNPSYPACPLVLHKQPHRLCVSADDLLPAGCQSCTAVFWGPSLRVARSVWPPGRGPRLSAGGSPRFGRDASGNSSGSPSALLWPSECRACTASVGSVLPTALKQRLRLSGPTARSVLLPPSSQADLEGMSGHQGGPLGPVARPPRSCCCITSS